MNYRISFSRKRQIYLVSDTRDPAAVATFQSRDEAKDFVTQECESDS